jgi:hypothetical protein
MFADIAGRQRRFGTTGSSGWRVRSAVDFRRESPLAFAPRSRLAGRP